MTLNILHLCADTGSDTSFYSQDPRYNVTLIGQKIGIENFKVREPVHGIIANPVCTEFSRARVGGKASLRGDFLWMVREVQRVIAEAESFGELKWWVIENPATGALKEFLGEPSFVYQPWEFGSPWTKKTALWGKFESPKKLFSKWEEVEKIPELYIRPGRKKPSLAIQHKSAIKFIPEFSAFEVSSDAEFRSLCSQKFAEQFYLRNP